MTNNNISSIDTVINASPVEDKHRFSFLPKHFGNQFIKAETILYNTMSNFCTSYEGGLWNFYELSNGGFYLAPHCDENLTIFVPSNGYEGTMSADAAGIVVSLFVINHLACKYEEDQIIKSYYLLRDFALEHNEGREILSAID